MLRKIASFTINHDVLTPGMYVSRIDGNDITYDLRCKTPNQGDYLEQKALHTLEHLIATYVRSSDRSDEVVYFGPMGCRTGCYIVMFGDMNPEDIADLVAEMCDFIIGFEGEIPGARPEECGNYLDQNLEMAKYYIRKYKKDLTEKKNYVYKD